MSMDEKALQERIKQLAQTLKATGIAASESRAMEMAKDIVSTEQRQLKSLEAKKHDRSLNPQQRVGSDGAALQNVSYAGPKGIDASKPISELLDEEQEEAPVKPQEANPAKPQTEEKEVLDFTETPESSIQEKTSPKPAENVQAETAKEIVREGRESQQRESAPKPVGPLTGANPSQKAFGLFAQQATAHVENKQAPQQAPAPQKPAEEKKPQTKVDLSEMFNFAKRK